MGNKQLQYTYYSIPQDAKTTRQWDFASYSFLEKSYTKCSGETISKPLSLDHWSKVLVCFCCKARWELSKYIENKLYTTYLYLIQSFSKDRKRSGTSLSAIFCMIFEEEILFSLRPNFMFGCLYLMRFWAISILQLFVNKVVRSQILKLTLPF